MTPKKNPSKDPSKNSFMFFSLAFVSLLWIALYLLDFPFQQKNTQHMQNLPDAPLVDLEENPLEKFIVETTVASKPNPFVNNMLIDNTNKPDDHQDPEPDKEPTNDPEPTKEPGPVTPSAQINYVDKTPQPEDFNLVNVEDAPIFPGCEKEKPENQKACFKKKMIEFVQKNTKYPDLAMANGQSGKVFVEFMVTNQGDISILRVSGPYPILEKEANRVISKLPKMIPGKQGNKRVNVKYVMPFTFNQM